MSANPIDAPAPDSRIAAPVARHDTAAEPTPGAVGPRLTKLEVHGFKSFATRTTLVFEQGITAVIGPNGSGKSNVSDAVRWVLGETSQNALRSRRTDDVIFAGGSGRAPLGMAEVTVTFDNSTGWLPSEFTEVTITRRAFRGGDSNYLINGRRVRLRDVHHLVASLGQSYTVVGQGLMDAALSQRPEERRGLFEHAADLAGLRMKAAEAERNLTEVDANSTRLNDLLSELEPRLKTLERNARQARDWQSVRDTLLMIQRTHYRSLYTAVAEATRAAQEIAKQAETAVVAGEARLATHVASELAHRQGLERATHALERFGAHLQATSEEAQRVGHQRDLAGERLLALSRRRQDMADTQAGLDEQAATMATELAGVVSQTAAVETSVAAAREAIAALRRETAEVSTRRADHEREVERLRRDLRDSERQATDQQRQAALLEQRRDLDAAELTRHERAIAERAGRIMAATADLTTHDRDVAGQQAAEAELTTRLAAIAERERTAAAAVGAARQELAGADRQLGEAAARHRALQQMHDSGAGLHAGVRAVVQAARTGELSGIRGTVGELIALPPRYDTAIEVALGGHLQDIVVDRWADAEAAIAHLRRVRAGRATFQPRETVRGRGGRGRPDAALRQPGVHGVASDLIETDEEFAGIAEALLGRTIVVDDLPVARSILGDLPTGFSAVTLGGDVARTGGSVTGGAAVRETGTLARERELRELPELVAALAGQRQGCLDALAVAEEIPTKIAAESRAVEADLAGLRTMARERAGQRSRLTAWLADLEREQLGAERRLAAIRQSIASRDDEQAAMSAAEATLAEDRSGLQTRLEGAETALAEVGSAATTAERAIADHQRDLATLEERLRAEHRRQASLTAQRQALQDELATRAERSSTLDGEIAALRGQRQRLERETSALESQLATAREQRQPLDAAVRAAQIALTRVTGQIDTERRAQLGHERARGEAGRGLERTRADLTAIELRIVDDLQLDDPAEILVTAEPAPTDGDVAAGLPMPTDPEREIARLRERLRRIGYVGDDAIGEFERESSHHAFMREQLDDVQQAAVALRRLLAELHATMRERFDETFGRVAAAFSDAFAELFGGGSARLVMTSAESSGTGGAAGGIDIVAQPPGKRSQNLSLLSGGERSLTAAALLIAILRVNPTPFCLLDEVDAALDEANVVRFRAQLQRLSQDTQVIVITHNRGTIEIANTLYGITMGADGVSKMLSLRMEETDAAE